MDFINRNPLTAAGAEDTVFRRFEREVLSKYHGIGSNWNFSSKKVQDLESCLEECFDISDPELTSVVAFGSYARLEASEASDLDYLVVTCDKDLNQDRAIEIVLKVIDQLSIRRPNPRGVFQGVVCSQELFSEIGSKADGYDRFSRRLLHLLESRPLWGKPAYRKNMCELMKEYGRDVANDPGKNYVFLLNDLIRYFRTICVNYAYSKSEEYEQWPIRNLKLRHSRVLMYLSLVAMLGVLSIYRHDDKNEKLEALVRLTPLERLFHAYKEAGDTGFYKTAGYYDVFLRIMSDKATRETLKGLEYEDRYGNREFCVLKANSDALAAELARFLFDRKGVWSDRFYEYLIL